MFGFDEKNKGGIDKIKERELITEYHKVEELTLELSKRVKNIKEINKDQDNEIKRYKYEVKNLKDKNIKLETEIAHVRKEIEKVKDEKKLLIEELEGIKRKLESRLEGTKSPYVEFKENTNDKEEDFDRELYEEALKYTVEDWRKILDISKNSGSDFLSIKVLNDLIKEKEKGVILEERLKLGVSFLEEIKDEVISYNLQKKSEATENKHLKFSIDEIKNLLAYSEGKRFISRISLGAIKFMIKLLVNGNELEKHQIEELDKHFTNAAKDGYITSVNYLELRENLLEERSNVIKKETRRADEISLTQEQNLPIKETDGEFEFIKIKNVKDFKLENWIKLGIFDESYVIFTNKEKQILNSIKMRIRNRIPVSNSELSKGEQCLKKAVSNGYEAYLIDYKHWEEFLKKSTKENLLKSVDLGILESALRRLKEYDKLSKDQLISLKDMYRDVKDIISVKKINIINENKVSTQENDVKDLLILGEMKNLKFREWNNIYMWVISKKVLSNDELKKLRDIKTACIMGSPKEEELKAALKVYKKIKTNGYEKGKPQNISGKSEIKSSGTSLNCEEKSIIELSQTNKENEISIVKKYKEALKSITEDYISFSQLARMVNRDIFQVKSEMRDLGIDWHVGRGYYRKEILEELEDQLNIGHKEVNNSKDSFEMKCGTFIRDMDKKITFKILLEKGLKEGTVKAIEVQKIDYDNEFEVSDYYEAVEELEDRGIRIETT